MKNFRELIEATGTVVFTFGRFNPPTTGHEKLIKKVASVAGSNPFRIYPSYSQNPKKDPLPFALKIAYMRKMFPKYARNIVADTDARTAINIAVKLHDEGFQNLIMVAGSDRVKEFSSLLKTYNGVEGKRHGFYKFDTIDVVSAGERDPDAEGVAGMSASKMRAAASVGDFESFSQGLPSGFRDAKKLYTDVRKNMGIREQRDMGEMNDFESLRDMYLTGQIWNVGDLVEANGVEGRVIRKGTNYLSFNDRDGKVHKAWLHEVKLDERKTRQDPDVKGREGTQPAKYYGTGAKGTKISPSTKEKRAAHFAKKKAGPAPGDASAKTKPSKHTKKFKQMYGEVNIDERNLTKTQQDKLDDLETYLGHLQRVTATPSRRAEIEATKKKIKKLKSEFDPEDNQEDLDEMTGFNVPELIKTTVHRLTHPKGYADLIKKYIEKVKSEREKRGHQDTNASVLSDVAHMFGIDRVKPVQDYVNKLVKRGKLPQELAAEYEIDEEFQLDEKITALVNKAKKSGMPYSILKKVYDRGMAAYKTGHRRGATPQQWALARVNSFTTKSSGTWGKADKDLADKVRASEEVELDEKPNYLRGGYFTLGVKGGSSRGEMTYYDAMTYITKEGGDIKKIRNMKRGEFQGKDIGVAQYQ